MFRRNAESGDILLFTGKAFFCKFQQFVTRSRFGDNKSDHVALILKFVDDSVIILEATGSEGVALAKWDDFQKNKWHELYHRIVYRSLIFNRNDNDILLLENHVKV